MNKNFLIFLLLIKILEFHNYYMYVYFREILFMTLSEKKTTVHFQFNFFFLTLSRSHLLIYRTKKEKPIQFDHATNILSY
jgi:hypothetical protein